MARESANLREKLTELVRTHERPIRHSGHVTNIFSERLENRKDLSLRFAARIRSVSLSFGLKLDIINSLRKFRPSEFAHPYVRNDIRKLLVKAGAEISYDTLPDE